MLPIDAFFMHISIALSLKSCTLWLFMYHCIFRSPLNLFIRDMFFTWSVFLSGHQSIPRCAIVEKKLSKIGLALGCGPWSCSQNYQWNLETEKVRLKLVMICSSSWQLWLHYLIEWLGHDSHRKALIAFLALEMTVIRSTHQLIQLSLTCSSARMFN